MFLYLERRVSGCQAMLLEPRTEVLMYSMWSDLSLEESDNIISPEEAEASWSTAWKKKSVLLFY